MPPFDNTPYKDRVADELDKLSADAEAAARAEAAGQISSLQAEVAQQTARGDAAEKRMTDHMRQPAPAGHPTSVPDPEPGPDPVPDRAPLIGSSVNGPLFKTLGYSSVDTARTYFRALPSGSRWQDQGDQKGGIPNDNGAYTDLRDAVSVTNKGGILSVSYKEANVDRAAAFFATMPKDRPYDVTCTWYHEPDDNFTSAAQQADYRAAWRDHAAMMRQYGMVPTLILMRYSLQKASGRNWRDWYPGDGVVDVTGWDCYRKNEAGSNGPGAIATMMEPMERIAHDTGTLTGLFETGSTRQRYADADSAAWAKSEREHILADEADVWLCAQWWDKDLFTFTPAIARAWLNREPRVVASKLSAA